MSIIETLWEHISAIAVQRDEQLCLNEALEDMEIVWSSTTSVARKCDERDGWEGEGGDGLRVYVFPQHMFCRRACCRPGMSRWELYLVHPFGEKNKMSSKVDALKKMNSWFLGEDDTIVI